MNCGNGGMFLTASEVAAHKATDKRQIKSCGGSLFLMIEPLSKGGGKSFLGVTRFPSGSPNNGGKRVEVLIGPYGEGVGKWTLNEARDEWDRICAWSKENKRDPRELMKEEKLVPAQESLGPTLGEVSESCEIYQKELASNPHSSSALVSLGLFLLQNGKAAEAIEPLVTAAAINPTDQCLLLLAQSYQRIGKLEEAITHYRKLDYSKSKNKMIAFNLGLCLLKTGVNIDAIEAFKLAIKLDQSFLPALGNIGTALINEGRYKEALSATQKVLEIKPYNPTAHMNLGIIHKELGNLDQALSFTLKSIELKPDNPTAHMNLGIIYKELGNLDQALSSTLKSLEINPNHPAAYMNLCGIYKDLGKLDQALSSTLKSIELKSDNSDAHMNLGIIYKELGNLDEALSSTLKSLEINPNNPDAHMNLGEIYFEIADYKKSEEAFDAVINMNGKAKITALRGKAACLFIDKDYDKSLELIKGLPFQECSSKSTHVPKESEIKSIIYAKIKEKYLPKIAGNVAAAAKEKDCQHLIKVAHRPVTQSLINELYGISNREFSATRDARNGAGFCTDFKLLSHDLPQIRRLEADLIHIIKECLGKEPCSLKYDSFFNIFKDGSGTKPHNHLTFRDRQFDLWKHKYSLVYYVDTGDQNCDQPGILKCIIQM